MKQLMLLLLPAMVAISSCDNYGEKVEIGKSEVYYKGEGVTKEDAQKVGNFLQQNKLFNSEQESSAQVAKENGAYIVRLVMDAKTTDPGVKLNLWKMQVNLSKEVFGGTAARFAFTDDHLKDQEVMKPVSTVKEGNTSITFSTEDFKPQAMQNLAAFLLEKGLLTRDKEADLLVRKEGDTPVVRVIVVKDFIQQNEADALPVFGYWQHLIVNKFPELQNATFWLTTTEYEDYKKVPRLKQEEIAEFENLQAGAANENTEPSTAPGT